MPPGPTVDRDDHDASQAALRATFSRDPTDPSIAVADGRGVKVIVDRGHLLVADGLGRHRRERRWPRASRELRRLVILGRSGFVSLEAVRWCEAVGVALVVLDGESTVLTSARPGIDDSRLRRAQAAAWGTPVGLAVAVDLLATKLAHQASVVRSLLAVPRPDVASTLSALADTVTGASDLDEARQLEAVGAALYFETWTGLLVTFATGDRLRVPDQWHRYGGRRSPLAGTTNRKAATPINALLNYLYALAEAECRLAALAVGLDPGLGVLHADHKSRDSMALDLIEPVRPHVEAYVLRLLAERTFRRLDFAELPDGTVRVNPPLSHDLAATMPGWAKAVAPAAERVAHTFAAAASGKVGRSTPLTRSHHRHRQGKAEAAPRLPGITPTCRRCGVELASSRATYCPPCWRIVRVEQQREASAAAAQAARARAAAGKRSPAHDDEAEARRLTSLRAALDRRVIEHGGGWTAESFDAVILPALATIELATIMDGIGVGRSSASRIRSGTLRPHPKRWPALASLARVTLPTMEV